MRRAAAANPQGYPSAIRTARPTHSIAAQFDASWSSPAICGVPPNAGPTAGDTTVTITGMGFTEITGLEFGGMPPSYTLVSSGEIIAT
jgi:hypothetical protein